MDRLKLEDYQAKACWIIFKTEHAITGVARMFSPNDDMVEQAGDVYAGVS